ncbi:MAG: beta-propeller fold lactonase family protein [Bacteroidia bacterium]
MKFRTWLLLTGLTVSLAACRQTPSTEGTWIAYTPADTAYCRLDPAGSSILPNGRLVRPYGQTLRIAPHPYGLILSPDGKTAITANSGTRPFSISIIRDLDSGQPRVQQIPDGPLNDEDLLSAVFMGLAVHAGDGILYAAGGQANVIYRFDLASGSRIDSIPCDRGPAGHDYSHGYIGDMVLSHDGKRLYAVDQIGFALLVIDTERGALVQRLPVGRYPFGICLSPDGSRVYVANVGMFAYQPIPGITLENRATHSLTYPAFAYNSPEMREGTEREGKQIPGLGDPNAPEAFSVWTIDVRGDTAQVVQKIKTGILVGEEVEGIPAVGGASPNSLVATERYVFVSNGNNDAISVIDTQTDTVSHTIRLRLDPRLGHLRGIIPFGLALSPDQRRLYVAESGINAVGVIDVEKMEQIGHIPVGWFPSKLAVSPDGRRLVVANAKGYGSGPNGGSTFAEGGEGSYIGHLMKGSVTIMDLPDDRTLQRLSQEVVDNNVRFARPTDPRFAARDAHPIPLYPGEKASPIKYIVFISKENRTYDEVFGQLAKGRGEAALARYGMHASFKNQAGTDSVQDAGIMVNHLALARRFAISDNFYVDADHSADGHRWLVSTYPNEWVETSVSAAYGGKRGMRPTSQAPGNWALTGASGAIYPEDYNEHGSLWDHLERNGVPFFNFGFGMELEGSYDDSTLKYTGVRPTINFPLPGPLYDCSSHAYPTYNMAIPDQFRADRFIEEFSERWLGEGRDMPRVLTVLLPNDHGAGDRPHAGYPFRESYMADNDLALGRVIEFLSSTPYWKEMAIFITEDDSQNGVDHVDAHRSLLLVVSPWTKRDHVSHVHSSFGSIFKTFWHILGIPYLNQYDATASDLSEMFTDQPDYTPYTAFPVDARVFDPQRVLDPFDEAFDWKALIESPNLDDPEVLLRDMQEADRRREQERNRLSNPRGE